MQMVFNLLTCIHCCCKLKEKVLLNMKSIKVTLGAGEIFGIGFFAFTFLLFIYGIGHYNGKWDTINAYKYAKVIEGPTISLKQEGILVKTIDLSVIHPTLSEDSADDWMLKNKPQLLYQLKHPRNLLQRFFSFYPDIPINLIRPIPKEPTEQEHKESKPLFPPPRIQPI
jgi:hypothetical protein